MPLIGIWQLVCKIKSANYSRRASALLPPLASLLCWMKQGQMALCPSVRCMGITVNLMKKERGLWASIQVKPISWAIVLKLFYANAIPPPAVYCLSWRATIKSLQSMGGKGFTAQDMCMQMRDFLAGIFTCIHDKAIAIFFQTQQIHNRQNTAEEV